MRRLAVIVLAGLGLAFGAGLDGRGAGPSIPRCTGAKEIQFRCYERRYTAMVRVVGAAAALRDLTERRSRNGYVRAACHQLTHRLGRAAGARTGLSAFRHGDPLCSSGYYHGVTEAVMAELGAARAATVCEPFRRRFPHGADHYNCAHGMGHGFMGLFASDIFASLRGCDALADRWERHNCYGGVFMENLSALDNPERPPRALRPTDPLYPCAAVGRRYRQPCFDKQTSYALYVTDSDYREVFELCARVEPDFRAACYRGLGGDVAVESTKHLIGARARTASRRRLCRLGPDGRARSECVRGAVIVILRDLEGGAAQAGALCRTLRGRLARACRDARTEAYRDLPLQPGT